MRLKNTEADYYLSVLKTILKDVSGKLGYAVARNARELTGSLVEYIKIKNELIAKYGERRENEYVISKDTEGYKKFQEEIISIAEIEHDIPIMLVDPEDVYNSTLTADKIGELFFMIKDGEDNG